MSFAQLISVHWTMQLSSFVVALFSISCISCAYVMKRSHQCTSFGGILICKGMFVTLETSDCPMQHLVVTTSGAIVDIRQCPALKEVQFPGGCPWVLRVAGTSVHVTPSECSEYMEGVLTTTKKLKVRGQTTGRLTTLTTTIHTTLSSKSTPLPSSVQTSFPATSPSTAVRTQRLKPQTTVRRRTLPAYHPTTTPTASPSSTTLSTTRSTQSTDVTTLETSADVTTLETTQGIEVTVDSQTPAGPDTAPVIAKSREVLDITLGSIGSVCSILTLVVLVSCLYRKRGRQERAQNIEMGDVRRGSDDTSEQAMQDVTASSVVLDDSDNSDPLGATGGLLDAATISPPQPRLRVHDVEDPEPSPPQRRQTRSITRQETQRSCIREPVSARSVRPTVFRQAQFLGRAHYRPGSAAMRLSLQRLGAVGEVEL